MTGSSGGGTLTTYVSMLDARVKAASIVTYITSFRKKIEARADDSESDPEQDLFGPLAGGVDHTEFVGLIAPRPVLIGAALKDFFPIEGTRVTFAELRQVYANAGAPERVDMVAFDHKHMYSQPLREATTAWFNRWLKGESGAVHEPAITVEDDHALACTPTGQVITSLGGETLGGINRARTAAARNELAAGRRRPEFRQTLAARCAGAGTAGDGGRTGGARAGPGGSRRPGHRKAAGRTRAGDRRAAAHRQDPPGGRAVTQRPVFAGSRRRGRRSGIR